VQLDDLVLELLREVLHPDTFPWST